MMRIAEVPRFLLYLPELSSRVVADLIAERAFATINSASPWFV
jgi:hypothetical protein